MASARLRPAVKGNGQVTIGGKEEGRSEGRRYRWCGWMMIDRLLDYCTG